MVLPVRFVPAILGILLVACGSDGSRSSIRIVVNPDPTSYRSVDLAGLSPETLRRIETADFETTDWASVFAVFTIDSAGPHPGLPPVAGTYSIEPPVLRFRSRYPLVAGLSYRVRVDPTALENRLQIGDVIATGLIDTVIAMPVEVSSSRSGPASVTAVYPTTDQLPANQLKFYIHFSAPMAEGLAYSNVRLIDDRSGQTIVAPFLELEPELWDPDRRRFTLLINPGRVKQEVGPNVELGPPLRPGRIYRLEISPGWLDAAGRPLREGHTKTFQAVEADRAMLDVGQWTIDAPPAESRHPVIVNFREPLDHALMTRVISVVGAEGTPLIGVVGTSDQERKWRFTPAQPWEPGRHELHVETILEDLAGNTLRSLFDVDLQNSEPSQVREAEQVRVIPFRIRR